MNHNFTTPSPTRVLLNPQHILHFVIQVGSLQDLSRKKQNLRNIKGSVKQLKAGSLADFQN